MSEHPVVPINASLNLGFPSVLAQIASDGAAFQHHLVFSFFRKQTLATSPNKIFLNFEHVCFLFYWQSLLCDLVALLFPASSNLKMPGEHILLTIPRPECVESILCEDTFRRPHNSIDTAASLFIFDLELVPFLKTKPSSHNIPNGCCWHRRGHLQCHSILYNISSSAAMSGMGASK